MIGRVYRNKHFDVGARLTLTFVGLMLLYSFADVAYRFTIPTDGWQVSEAVEIGMVYVRDLSGSPSPLQPGDHVIEVNAISADWRVVQKSDALRAAWKVGAVIDFTVVREGQQVHVPVTLKHWDGRAWAWAQFTNPVVLTELITAWVLFALALVVFLKRPDNLAAGSFLIVVSGLTFSGLSDLLPRGFATMIDPLASLYSQYIGNVLYLVVFSFSFVRFSMVFPKPSNLYIRFPSLPFVIGGIGLSILAFFPTSDVSWFWFVFSLVLGVGLLIRNAFKMRDPVSQAQIRWGVGGIMAGFGTLTIMVVVNTSGAYLIGDDVFAIVSSIGLTLMGVMLSIGISRYRLFDIDVILRRTLQYALLTGVLALLYFGGIVLLQGIFEAVAGTRESPLITVISTLGIAALFNPLRLRIQGGIDMRFYRRKYDAEQSLVRFSAAARDEVDLERLSFALLDLVSDTMQPEKVDLWLK